MARIEGLPQDQGDMAVRRAYEGSKELFGTVLEPLAVTARHAQLLEGYVAFEWAFSKAERVDRRTKELATIKAAALVGCEFCLDIGSAGALKSGVTPEELAALPSYRESELFGERDKLVLDYAVGMTRTPVDVPDHLFEELREHFDDEQLVELTTAIALENYRGRFNWALEIGPQGFVGGGVCAVPETAP
jgi:AhpD family alkylhydroperoxidase